MSLLRHIYLAYFSHPASDRILYRAIRRQKVQRIVEIGVGTAERSKRLIIAAKGANRAAAVRYTGIDLFEARPAGAPPGLSLKDAYRLLKPSGAQTQLVPGDPLAALARVANALAGTELVVISADQDPALIEKAWFYLPRLLDRNSLVYCEEIDTQSRRPRLRLLSRAEIEKRSGSAQQRRAA